MVRKFSGKFFNALVLVLVLSMAVPWAAFADEVVNNIDNTVDATLESMTLTAGGTAGFTTLSIDETNGDGKNGCNLTSDKILKISVSSSDAAKATVSLVDADDTTKAEDTFDACSDTIKVKVTPVAAGSANITFSVVSNTTDGTFNLAPAAFSVTVNAAAPTAQNTAISAVSGSGTYGGTATLTAKLAAGTTGVSGKSIAFSLNGVTVDSATTNSSGVATISGVDLTGVDAGTYAEAVAANFAGDSSYNSSLASGALSVAKASGSVNVDANSLSQTYNGSGKAIAYTTTPAGKAVDVVYSQGTGAEKVTVASPTNAGAYDFVATINDTNYQGSASGTLNITKANQTVTWAAIGGKTYGDAAFTVSATASSGLTPVTYSKLSGPCGLSGNTVTITGAGDCVLRASQSGDGNYNSAYADTTINIAKANQTITWVSIPSDKTYGDADFTVSADASSGNAVTFSRVSGECTVTSAGSVSITGAGSCVVRASQAGDGNYNSASSDRTISIAKANQAITFAELSSKTYGNAAFAVSATGGASGNPVTFSAVDSTATCSVAQNAQGDWMVSILGAGDCTIRASQAGNGNYNAAPNVDRTFAINKAQLTVTAADASRYYGDANPATFGYGITGFVNGETLTTSGVSGDANCGTQATQASAAGPYDITCVQGTLSASNYSFRFAKGTLTIDPRPVTVKAANAAITYGDARPTYSIELANGTMGNGEELSVLGTPEFSTDPATPVNAGTYPIAVSGLSNVNYSISYTTGAAMGKLTINKAAQVINFGALGSKTYGDAAFTVSANGGDSGNPVTFSVVDSVGVCSVSGDTVSILGAGSCTIRASQAGNGNYFAAADVDRIFTVNRAPLTVTANNASRYYGDANPAFTGMLTGVVNGDNITATYATTATATSAPGNYPIVPTLSDPGSRLGNYNVTSNNGTLSILNWTLKGFYAPVDMGTSVVNTVKGGSTVPLKFEVFKGTTELKDATLGMSTSTVKSLSAVKVNCTTGVIEDLIEELAATGGTALRFDTTGDHFIYNWKTPTTLGCYKTTVTMVDGSTITANFKIK